MKFNNLLSNLLVLVVWFCHDPVQTAWTTERPYPMPSCLQTTFVDSCFGGQPCGGDPCADTKNPFRPAYCFPENARVITNVAPPLRSTPPLELTIRYVETEILYRTYTDVQKTKQILLLNVEKTGVPLSVTATSTTLVSSAVEIPATGCLFVLTLVLAVISL